MGQRVRNMLETLHQIGDALDKVVDLDFWLYIFIALFGGVSAVLGGNDAILYISAQKLFYLRSFCSIAAAVLLAAKMYRSTKFAQRKQTRQVELAKVEKTS